MKSARKNQADSVIIFAILFFVLLLSFLPAFSESVFLRDGNILEGDIIKETNQTTTLKKYNGTTIVIPRKEILRTQVNDLYKTPMFIMKTDGNEIAVHIVDEDNEKYTCRWDLYSPYEFPLLKSNVLSISKIPFTMIAKEKIKKEQEIKEKERRAREKGEVQLPWYERYHLIVRTGFSIENLSNDLFGVYNDKDTAVTFEIYSLIHNKKSKDERHVNWYIFGFRSLILNMETEDGNSFAISPADSRTATVEKLFGVPITYTYSSRATIRTFTTGLMFSLSYVGKKGELQNLEPWLQACLLNFGQFTTPFLHFYLLFAGGIAYFDATLRNETNHVDVGHIEKKSYVIEGGLGEVWGSFITLFAEIRVSYIPIKIEGESDRLLNVSLLFGAGIHL